MTIILGSILVSASMFSISCEYLSPYVLLGQELQVVHSNDYTANIDTTIDTTSQAPLAVHSQILEPLGTIVKSLRGDKIDFSSKRLINNLWGAPPEEILSCEVYLTENKTYGWHWDRPDPLTKPGINGCQPLYPNVRTGGCPWEPSIVAEFPVKLSEVKTLQLDVEYSYSESPTGIYNLAYDMFLSDTNQASSDPKPEAEIMIWLQHTLQQPADAYIGDVSDGINTYGYYSFTMQNGRLYYAFLLKEQTPLKGQLTVDVKKLMDYLELDPNWYLHGVEFGNEVINGSGKIEISKNDVNLNGHEL